MFGAVRLCRATFSAVRSPSLLPICSPTAPARYAAGHAQAAATERRYAFLTGFQRAYTTNRAPLIIGNHFERWNGGIYMDAVADAARRMAQHDSVRFVSFRQLIGWLDAQNPVVLDKLRTLPVGKKPTGGWAEFLGTPYAVANLCSMICPAAKRRYINSAGTPGSARSGTRLDLTVAPVMSAIHGPAWPVQRSMCQFPVGRQAENIPSTSTDALKTGSWRLPGTASPPPGEYRRARH
jgi:hypothetical protein